MIFCWGQFEPNKAVDERFLKNSVKVKVSFYYEDDYFCLNSKSFMYTQKSMLC